MPIFGIATFPGLSQIVEASFDFTTGVTPSMATLTIAPQVNFTAQVGTLTFFDNMGVELQWPNARVDTNSFERNSSGLIWRLVIYDRRWKWQQTGGGGIVFGGANLRWDDGTMISKTERDPQTIAKACLDAMGETGYDVSALPNNDRPEILWDGNLPAHALDELCESLGCRVVLGLDDNVKICVVGTGANLPDTPDVMTSSGAMTVPGIPDRICAVCAPDRFQCDLELEAVGRETDGSYQLLQNLSYIKATGGVAAITDPGDLSIIEDVVGEDACKLAEKYVFRYYRVKFPIPSIPGYIDTQGNPNASVSDPWRVKLEDEQVEMTTSVAEDGSSEPQCKPAQVFGVFCDESDDSDSTDKNNVPGVGTPYDSDPSLSSDGKKTSAEVGEPWSWHLGHEGRVGQAKDLLVVFSQPIYQWANPANPGSGYAPATLYLRTAITLLDNFTFSPVRSYFSRDTGAGLNTPPRFDLFSDLQEWHYYSYSDKNTVDNFADLQGDANYYINGILQEYQANTPQTVTYAGMKRIDLDGAIQHVHWHVGKSGCTTTASRNNEQIHRVQPLSYRKLMGKLKSGLREQHKHKSTLRSHRRREGGHE